MRSYPAVLTICCLVVLLGACSDIDEDPIGDKCAEKCTIASTHACYTKKINGVPAQQQCLNDCKSLAGAAEKDKKYWPGCGLCVAGTFSYSVKTDPPCDKTPSDPACCYGRMYKNPTDKECISQCFEPDGGPAF